MAAAARDGFERVDMQPGGAGLTGHPGHGARLFSRIAHVLQCLDALPALRERVASRALSPEAATALYIDLVAGLLAVVFEAADSAPEPGISRLLVALFNFMQGKEFAGQERATGVAAFGAGVSDAPRQQHWLDLIASQERCFQVFAEFAPPHSLALWQESSAADATLAVIERLRRVGCTAAAGAPLSVEMAEPWFDNCSQRMDALQTVEARLPAELQQQCQHRIADARAALQTLLQAPQALATTPVSATLAPGELQPPAARLGWPLPTGPGHRGRSAHPIARPGLQSGRAGRHGPAACCRSARARPGGARRSAARAAAGPWAARPDRAMPHPAGSGACQDC